MANARPTRDEAIRRAGVLVAQHVLLNATRSPRELAEAAYNPTRPDLTVDVLEDRIRARRGLPPLHAEAS